MSTEVPSPAAGALTVRPAPDVIVDAAYVKERLELPAVKVLDVRTTMEWNNGHLPGATLILWQDLYADARMLKFKSIRRHPRAADEGWRGAKPERRHLLRRRHAREPDVLGGADSRPSPRGSTSARGRTGSVIRVIRSSSDHNKRRHSTQNTLNSRNRLFLRILRVLASFRSSSGQHIGTMLLLIAA